MTSLGNYATEKSCWAFLLRLKNTRGNKQVPTDYPKNDWGGGVPGPHLQMRPGAWNSGPASWKGLLSGERWAKDTATQ